MTVQLEPDGDGTRLTLERTMTKEKASEAHWRQLLDRSGALFRSGVAALLDPAYFSFPERFSGAASLESKEY